VKNGILLNFTAIFGIISKKAENKNLKASNKTKKASNIVFKAFLDGVPSVTVLKSCRWQVSKAGVPVHEAEG